MPSDLAWWERFWQLVALAISVAALASEAVFPTIRWAIERL